MALVGVLAGCVQTSEGGEVITLTDPRIPEVLAAREALAEPVPALVAAARALVDGHGDVLTLDDTSARRAEVAAAVSRAPLESVLDTLRAIELEGEGPDVATVSALVVDLVAAGDELDAAVAAELGELVELGAFDAELTTVADRFDEPGSRSAQVALFEELAAQAIALGERAAAATSTLPCADAWARRMDAATTVAFRAEEARGHVASRRGLAFDELRDEHRADPFGLGADLGALDAAAAACWPTDSGAPAALGRIDELVAELALALDPADLR